MPCGSKGASRFAQQAIRIPPWAPCIASSAARITPAAPRSVQPACRIARAASCPSHRASRPWLRARRIRHFASRAPSPASRPAYSATCLRDDRPTADRSHRYRLQPPARLREAGRRGAEGSWQEIGTYTSQIACLPMTQRSQSAIVLHILPYIAVWGANAAQACSDSTSQPQVWRTRRDTNYAAARPRGSIKSAAIQPTMKPPRCVSQASWPSSAHHIARFIATRNRTTRATGQRPSRKVKRST